MTKKDYVLIASTLHLAGAHRDLIDHACNLLKKDNPNFNEDIFRKECAAPMTFVRATLRNS